MKTEPENNELKKESAPAVQAASTQDAAGKNPVRVRVRILRHETVVGPAVCAAGAVLELSAARAKALSEIGAAEIIGVA